MMSEEEKETIIRLRNDGVKIDAIATELGRSNGFVCEKIRRLTKDGCITKFKEMPISNEPVITKQLKSLGCKCKFPECVVEAVGTFALVLLCELHYESIWYETKGFYKGRKSAGEAKERQSYMKIRKFTKFKKSNLWAVQ